MNAAQRNPKLICCSVFCARLSQCTAVSRTASSAHTLRTHSESLSAKIGKPWAQETRGQHAKFTYAGKCPALDFLSGCSGCCRFLSVALLAVFLSLIELLTK